MWGFGPVCARLRPPRPQPLTRSSTTLPLPPFLPFYPPHAPPRRDFLYNVGKVLVFITALPAGAATPSALGSGPERVARVRVVAEHLVILQDVKRSILRHCPEFVPAFLSLIAPCLEPGREKTAAETNALDLTLTLFKQVRKQGRPRAGGGCGAHPVLHPPNRTPP